MSIDKHVARFETNHKMSDEEIVASCSAFREGTVFEGACILTNKRLVFIRAGMLSEKIEPWPVGKITSVEAKKGLIQYHLKAYISGDDIALLSNDKRGMEGLVRSLQDAVNGIGPVASGNAPDQDGDPMCQLAKLGELRDADVISNEEFMAKKAELLARI